VNVHSVVCIKQVLDQDIPPRAFRVDRAARRPDVAGAPLVMSIFDGNALETALKLREAQGSGTVTALSIGPKSAEEVLRKALAVTADQAVLVAEGDLDALDAPARAALIAAAVRRLTPAVDLVLCGRQAGDWESGQVGSMVAEALGWPCVTLVSRITPASGDGRVRLRREVEDGYEVVEAAPPLVVTVTNGEGNVLRLAKVRDVMMAHRKPVTAWTAADLGVAAPSGGAALVDLFIPEKSGRCEFVEGKTPAEKATNLVRRLRELKVL
jgi:electron transfer flavoprotein beta subunit